MSTMDGPTSKRERETMANYWNAVSKKLFANCEGKPRLVFFFILSNDELVIKDINYFATVSRVNTAATFRRYRTLVGRSVE